MAVAVMSKLRLIGMEVEKDRLLDALAALGAVDLVEKDSERDENFLCGATAAEAEHAVRNVELLLERAKFLKIPVTSTETVRFDEFCAVSKRTEELGAYLSRVDELEGQAKRLEAEAVRLENERAALIPYLSFDGRFCDYTDSASVRIFFGTIPTENFGAFTAGVKKLPLTEVQAVRPAKTPMTAVLFATHKSVEAEAESFAARVGFSKCADDSDVTAVEKRAQIDAQIFQNKAEQEKVVAGWKDLAPQLRDLKIFADYLRYAGLKETAAELDFEYTAKTFSLTGFVPKTAEAGITKALEDVTNAVWFDFVEAEENDLVPTLTRNGEPGGSFEFVTNLFSVPKYRELDPNKVMGVFFMLFFGFIMADIGYGILLAAICIPVGLKMQRSNAARSLVLLLGYGGIFTLLWGLLFGSLFGLPLGFGVLPDAGKMPATYLVYCLAAGVLQIFVGYLLKGIQALRQGEVFDAIADGFGWAIFSVGVLLALPKIGVGMFSAKIGFAPPEELLYAGLGVAGAALLFEMLVAGRKEKTFGKLTKGFGAAYGTINFLSDVLSYARLFGLMLSGSMVANIISKQSLMLIDKGIGWAVLGAVILLVGHLFNLAISVLGAYIHDSRLQYIEFYSRFYEGDGFLFRPLGRQNNFVVITNQ